MLHDPPGRGGEPLPSPCRADFDGDGTVNTADFAAYLNAWALGDDSADFDGDGDVDTGDFAEFIGEWAAGCP